MKKVLIFVLISFASFGQMGKLTVPEPKFIITDTTDYAVLTKKKKSATYIWNYYKSNYQGSLKWPRWRLAGFNPTDSTDAVTTLPSGFIQYTPPFEFYDLYYAGDWIPDITPADTFRLEVRQFDGLNWMTQKVDDNTFVLRGKNMAYREDVALIDSAEYFGAYDQMDGDSTNLGGLFAPESFTTPDGWYYVTLQDGTNAYSTIQQVIYYNYVTYGPYDASGDFADVTIATETSFTSNSTSQIIDIGSEMFIGATALQNKYYGISTNSGYKEIHINTIGVVDAIENVVFEVGYIESQLALKVATYNGEPQKNYINWEALPDITLSANLKVGYGTWAQFSEDMSGASLLGNRPAPLRKGFTNVGNTSSYANTSIGYMYTEASPHDVDNNHRTNQDYAELYGSAYVGRDEEGNDRWQGSTFLFNNEEENQSEWFFNTYVAKGAIDYAIANGNDDFIFLDYNLLDLIPTTKFSNYYYNGEADGANLFKQWWPIFDATKVDTSRELNIGLVFDSLSYDNVNYQRVIDNYYLAVLPDDVSLYQKSGSVYTLDTLGNRIVRSEDIGATLRGEYFILNNWGDRDANGILEYCVASTGVDGWKKNGVCYQGISGTFPYGANRIFHTKHQAERAIHGLSAHVSQNINSLIARNVEQWDSLSISEYREDVKWDYVPTFRERTESLNAVLYEDANPALSRFNGYFDSQPISNFQTNAWFFQSMILFGRAQLWNGHGNNIPRPMGEPFDYLNVNTGQIQSTPYDMSITSNITAGIHYLENLHTSLNLFSDDDKILVFMAPERVQDGEIVALGRMNGNNLFIMLAEPRLDIGETMAVTVWDGVDSVTTVTVEAREVSRVVLSLYPGTHSVSDIHISYVPLKEKDSGNNAVFNLTGDLINEHIYVP